MSTEKISNYELVKNTPTKEEAKQAIKLLLSYIGEDLSREGLQETPDRIIKSYEELFSGYKIDIEDLLNKKFHDIDEFSNVVLLKSIEFSSTCEHHMLPFTGTVDIAYIPNGFVVGISKLARLVDAYAKRLQIQEKLTSSIAKALQDNLNPKGVAIKISASHGCMTTRGVLKGNSVMDTVHYTGIFTKSDKHRQEFWDALKV
ncbi:MAG: GTP cyclohydrolase I FolE [Rickettsiaceae bacterium]|nr:GTP cyclohydrolase I FolE [Rickettsiaceae bacterium]